MKKELRSFFNSPAGTSFLGFVLLVPVSIIVFGWLMTTFGDPKIAVLWVGVILFGFIVLADLILFFQWLQDDYSGLMGWLRRFVDLDQALMEREWARENAADNHTSPQLDVAA